MKLQILITSFLLFCGIIVNAQNSKTSLQTGRISSSVNKIKEGNAVSCSEKEYKNHDSLDPIFVETCLFKSFKFVNKGSPDYKGRYSWEYSLYKKQNGKYVKVSNSALFNQKNQSITINHQPEKSKGLFRIQNSA